MTAARAVTLAAILTASAGLTGCLGLFGDDVAPASEDVNQQGRELIGDDQFANLDQLAAAVPRQYAFPLQQLLPSVRVSVNSTVALDSIPAYEGNQDQGGTEYNTLVKAEDIGAYLPVGQPAEIFIKLRWNAKEVNGAELDIFVDVPGVKTSYDHQKTEDMNWNVPTKSLTVNTIGVEGYSPRIGIQASNGKTTGEIPYELTMEFNYPKDVLTSYVPWAFHVPANASGVVIESAKVAGDENILSEFVVIGPDDARVAYITYNDLAIPTESVFVPTPKPGEYVFYAFHMRGGFLSIRSDAGLEKIEARPLKRVETYTSVDASPSPGIVEREWTHDSAAPAPLASPMTGQKEITFALESAHPLGVLGVITSQATAGTQVRLSSSAGVVHQIQRVLRYDDERGSIGYSSDEGINNVFDYEALVKGAYKMEYVNSGAGEVGYLVVTYQR